jgi:hypothetical protein
MRIGQQKPEKKRLKPPPDYSSRRMQWRLLAIVAALMAVVWVASEARNPQRWQWITQLDRLAKPQEEINPRLLEPAKSPSGDEVVIGQRTRPKLELASSDDVLSTDDRAWASGWEDVFGRLSILERKTFYELLKAARERGELAASQREAADAVIKQLDRYWAEYRAAAKAGLEELTEDEQAAWQPVLEKLELRWTTDAKPLLMIVARGEALSDEQHNHLIAVQDLLDRLELRAVVDNSPWRSSEREIWFRLLGKLQQRTPEELKQGSTGSVGYAQLFKQSESYRGKLVTVRGAAHDVYWVEAPENAYGIEKYWVYWLQPAGGPNSPILVYALHKPEGFPSIDIADSGRGKMPNVEDVEFTGFYFKRYAYQGQGGLYTAPMMLAREPVWIKSAFSSQPNLPSPVTFLAVASGLAVLAVALALWVYYQYRPGRQREEELPARIFIKSE